MMRFRGGTLDALLLVHLFVGVLSHPENEKALMNESALSANVLMKGLRYFQDRPEAITSDAILGVLIVRANLQWISRRLQNDNPFSKKLESLLKQCDDIVNSNRTDGDPILNKVAWDNAAEDLRRGNFNTEDYRHLLPKFESCESIDSYFMKGTPEDSDFCINELITSECKVSEECWISETSKKRHSGYKTSHRLLYFLIATQLECDKKNANKFHDIKTLKRNLCRQMLSEAKALSEEPHFALTRDLFLEHVTLCGLEGYEEFAPYIWRVNVRSWQNSKGCFGHDVDFNVCQINADREKRVKRTDTEVDGCHTHVTAVALSSLAFFLRYIVRTTFVLL